MNPQMQNPQPGKASGTQENELDLTHKNSIATNYSSCDGFPQAPDSSNNYSEFYNNTDDDLLEIAANLMPAWEGDQ